MTNLSQAAFMLLSALLIIIADAFIKKVSVSQTSPALAHPLMLVAYVLYFIQILIAIYIFARGGELAIYTNLYIIFYSILGVVTGIIIFSEHVSRIQYIGIVFAIIGAVLMNIH